MATRATVSMRSSLIHTLGSQRRTEHPMPAPHRRAPSVRVRSSRLQCSGFDQAPERGSRRLRQRGARRVEEAGTDTSEREVAPRLDRRPFALRHGEQIQNDATLTQSIVIVAENRPRCNGKP